MAHYVSGGTLNSGDVKLYSLTHSVQFRDLESAEWLGG